LLQLALKLFLHTIYIINVEVVDIIESEQTNALSSLKSHFTLRL